MAIPRSYGAHVATGGYRTVQMSFETGQQNTARLYFSERVQITNVRGEVTKALAGTDAGTITPKDASGNSMSGGVLTFAASAPLDNRQNGAPTANQFVGAGGFLELVAAKSTAGGTVQVHVEYTLAP